MANSININAASVVRPGTFVSQRFIPSAAQFSANHAVGYLFGTVEDDARELRYNSIQPYRPLQISSLADFTNKIGGVPDTSSGARVTYDAVDAFFSNAGAAGILYFVRVTPTPETIITVPESVTVGYDSIVININGVQYGGELVNIIGESTKRVIRSSGIDAADVAYDLYQFLSNDSDFNALFNVEEFSPDDAVNRSVRITPKSVETKITISELSVYKSSTFATVPEKINLLAFINDYTPQKSVNFRLKHALSSKFIYIDGQELLAFANNEALAFASLANVTTLISAYLTDKGTTVTTDNYIAVSSSSDSSFNSQANGWFNVTSVDPLVLAAKSAVRPTSALDSVQIFYVEIAGQSQAIIINPNNADDLSGDISAGIRDAIIQGLADEGIDKFYDVSSEYVPPNDSIAQRPVAAINSNTLMGTVSLNINSNILTGTGSIFLKELYSGAVIYIKDTRFVVSSIASNTSALLTQQAEVTLSDELAVLDRSEETGFYTFDPVVKVKLVSKNGTLPPVFPGVNRGGELDLNIVYTNASTEALSYETDKYFDNNKVKAQDFVYALKNAFNSLNRYNPGFIFAPEAYAILKQSVGGLSRNDALKERMKITAAIALVAEGRSNPLVLENPTQHIGLIDFGGDCNDITYVREELNAIRSTVGSAYGHLACFAPYIENLDGNFVPPSSFVAGIACARITNEGFQQPPAGAKYPVRGAVGLKFNITPQQQETTYGLGLNPLRSLPQKGIVVWGSRTISANADFKYINTRVILNIFMDVIGRSFDDILFERIDSPDTLLNKVSMIANNICHQFYTQGALFGNRPQDAYYILASGNNNSLVTLEQGSIICDIYLATSPTLERVFVSVVKTNSGEIRVMNESIIKLSTTSGIGNSVSVVSNS